MGRDNRQTAKFKFSNHRIEMYKPTDGQGAALAVSGEGLKKQDSGGLVRMFRIIESLVVDPKNWEAMDDGLVNGSVGLNDFTELLSDVFGYDWDGEAAKTKALAEQMRAKTHDAD